LQKKVNVNYPSAYKAKRSSSHPLSLKPTSNFDIVPSSQYVKTHELAKDPFQSIQRRLETIQVICRHRRDFNPTILLPAKTSTIDKMCEEAVGNCVDGCCSSIDKMCEETFGDFIDRCCSLPCFGKTNQEDYQNIRKAKKIATVRAQLASLQSPHPHDTDAMKEWRAKEIVKTKVELADLTGEKPPTVDPLQLPLLHEFELHELDVSITVLSLGLHSLFSCAVKNRVIYISYRHLLPVTYSSARHTILSNSLNTPFQPQTSRLPVSQRSRSRSRFSITCNHHLLHKDVLLG
jgi:hypothetical protein